MKLTVLAAAVLGFASAAVAVDDRQLVEFKPTSKNFCAKWDAHCKAYKPKHQGLTFEATLCEPVTGKHEAKVFCSFKDSTGKLHLVTKHVAAEVHAKIIPA